MTINGQYTRDATYAQLEHLLQGKRGQVLEFIRSRRYSGATRGEIADGLGWPINCVTGRVSELEEPEVDGRKRPDLGVIVTTDRRRTAASGKAVAVIVAKEFLGPPSPSKLDELRIAAVIEFVGNGNQWISPREIAETIVRVREHSHDQPGRKWPEGNVNDFILAAEHAVTRGVLKLLQGKVWLNVQAAQALKQADLASPMSVAETERQRAFDFD